MLKFLKKILIVGLAIFFLLIFWAIVSDDSDKKDKPILTEPTTETTTEVQSLAKDIDYEIKFVDDISYGNVVRKNLDVLVNNPEIIEQEDFEALCQKIVTEYTATTPVNALTLFFFMDERDFIKTGGYSFGRCTYYPNGNMGDSANVKTGDYSSFKYTYDFKKKDYSQKPTDEEFDIYYYLIELLAETDGSYEAEVKCTENTAQKFNMTVEEIDELFMKVNMFLSPY